MKTVGPLIRAVQGIPGTLFSDVPARGRRSNYPMETFSIDERFIDIDWREVPEDGVGMAHGHAGGLINVRTSADEGTIHGAVGGARTPLDTSSRKIGTEALAWYVSFHNKPPVKWGIYIPVSSLLYLSETWLYGLPTDLYTRILLAFRALHQHELFHFGTDYMAAQWEVITGRPCYVPAQASLKDPSLGYIFNEEKLANGQMLRAFRRLPARVRVKGGSAALREFVATQPPGYVDGPNVANPRAFLFAQDHLASDYIHTIAGYSPSRLHTVNLADLYPCYPNLDWRQCPIHIIHDEASLGLPPVHFNFFLFVRKIAETKKFAERLRKLSSDIHNRWYQTRNKLGKTTALSGLDFKLWTGDIRFEKQSSWEVWSVRVTKNSRAHLAWDGDTSSWFACDIGTHTALGHDTG